MQLIVLEGPDGTGKSTHADALADALREHGVDALSWHHEKPASIDPWLTAIEYARQRRAFCVSAHSGTTYVVDRWWWSTAAEGFAREGEWSIEMVHAYGDLSRAERKALCVPIVTIFLDASDAVIDARLAKRGTPATALDYRKRGAYRFFSQNEHVSVVRTDAPKADVQRALLNLYYSSI